MSLSNQDPRSERLQRRSKVLADFTRVGGLSNHLKTLRDIIIVPLLHSNVYKHFNIKTPKGVLFYGPPGTGKTLVAGALAAEINKQGVGKVCFIQKKSSEILDKWVGESEKKLRNVFETAARARPAIIFFDELDGLAPRRTNKNDHVHCSLVTTLLSLMDGLDSSPGVIVIGATNRIESVDPALRRPGRFDRELYFPLPSTEARKEIIQVHTLSWKHLPSIEFLDHLAEITTGFCGSDLEALCAETVLSAMKRLHPNLQKSLFGSRVKIEADDIRIEEGDFLYALRNLIPSSQKMGNRMRKLSFTVRPLLQKQLDNVLGRIKVLWPHFFLQYYKYLVGNRRYIGRVILTGTNVQCVNSHLIPAILHHFEHLPSHFIEMSSVLDQTILGARQTLPSILVLPRIDELWNCLDCNEQICLVANLEDIHAGLPILVIATCEKDIPDMLQNFFFNNSSVMYQIENPSYQEVHDFFAPIFVGESSSSLLGVLMNSRKNLRSCARTRGRIQKISSKAQMGKGDGNERQKTGPVIRAKSLEKICNVISPVKTRNRLALIISRLLQRSLSFIGLKPSVNQNLSNSSYLYTDPDSDKQRIYNLYRRTVHVTAKNMSVCQLELLYDSIATCITIHKENFEKLLKSVDETLNDAENIK